MATNGLSLTSDNHVKKVAVVGAGGRSGKCIIDALLQAGKHHVTAITRPDSTSAMPVGIHDIVKVDYKNRSNLVAALTGQDVLIVTMNVLAPRESQMQLIDAAIEAGVKYIMPNEWGVDHKNEKMAQETMMGDRYLPIRAHIEKHGAGKTFWIGLCCGFWYEFSLAGTEVRYGFDFEKKTVTLYDEGDVKINTSTWKQVGLAVARILSLPIRPNSKDDRSPCLTQYQNSSFRVSSFFVSQRDMLESTLRVTGDKESGWTISHENVVKRYERGVKLLKEGSMVGFGILLYARVFYDDGSGNYNSKLDNDVLDLPKEDFDDATKVAISMALSGETNMIAGRS